jgi:hypothetical protein
VFIVWYFSYWLAAVRTEFEIVVDRAILDEDIGVVASGVPPPNIVLLPVTGR